MSEEKPTFKITDRRLFNPDGSPREDVLREEDETPEPAAVESPAHEPATDETRASDEGEETASEARSEREDEGASRQMPSQEFLMLVEFVASFAADAMGMVNHPGVVSPEMNLPLAKQCIDMLGSLREKTRGNLAAEERQFIESLLSQLRMQYVSLTSAPRAPQGGGGGRGFTGGDITGGR